MLGLNEEIISDVSKILQQSWDIRDGRIVPETEVALSGGAVRINATVLYADLVQSSRLATEFQQRTAAKVIKIFLRCMCRLLSEHEAKITSFDGDRVMGIFIGDNKNVNAAKCALKMNYVTSKIIKPKLSEYFSSVSQSGFDISHCVGVDTSTIMAIRAGQRNSNDLVWIGRAPNLAAKLSDIRENNFRTYISEDVFKDLNNEVKLSDDARPMWEKCSIPFIGEYITIYRSFWTWRV